MRSQAKLHHSRGFTLVDAIVAMAILSIVLLIAASSLAQRPAEAHTTALELQSAVVYTRSLAQTAAGIGNPSGTGATLAVLPEPSGGTTVTVYRGRPIGGTTVWPALDEHFAEIRTHAKIRLSGAGVTHADPPFAVLVSSSGIASIAQNFDMRTAATRLAADPGCPAGTSAVLSVDSGTQLENHRLSCLDVSYDADATTRPTP